MSCDVIYWAKYAKQCKEAYTLGSFVLLLQHLLLMQLPVHHFKNYLLCHMTSKQAKTFNNIYFPPFHRSVLHINCQCSPERFIVKYSTENIGAKIVSSTLLLFRRDYQCDVGAKKFPCFETCILSMQIMVP